MTTIIIVFFILLMLGAIAAPIVFMQTRKTFREQKNYERGLKMVPVLIHLPPPSDDTEVGSRDVRDVTDETISQAETIYNIIASTWQEGFKHTFYGQRHFAFEIVGMRGFVYFYAAVPISLLEVVKQAIVSAYPAAQLEEAAEHNIFSQIGKTPGTLGGELTLKEPFAYPIATFKDTKRDAMQSLLNSLSNLGEEDGVGIQFLLRPANPEWRKQASKVASEKRKGGGGKIDFSGLAKDVGKALVKPPENKEGGDSNKSDLSSLESSTYDAIDEKTRHPGYEVVIRVVVSSNVSQKAQAILSNVIAAFSLYDAPGKNGFKYSPASDIDGLITSYIMRFMPQHHDQTILNSVELATLFHFPDQRNIPTSQLARQGSKQVDGPRNIPEEGLLLGYNLFRGTKKPIRLALPDRQRHMYVVGQTGTGKSTFLENLALQDMLSGNGFAFVDPHGDTAEKLLSMVPKERTEDVIYFSPADMEFPMGLNLFEFDSPDEKDFIIQEVLNMLHKLYDPNNQGIMGPRYDDMFRNAALAVMADPAGGTLIDIPKLFNDPDFLKQKIQHVTDQNVLDFWLKQFPASQRSNDAGEITSWFVSKFGAFLANTMMRNIIGQPKSSFNLRDIMDNKKILLVNLSKGRTGDLNSKLLGMIFVMKFQAAAMSRASIPEDERVDFSLYVDEFQNFSTDSFATIMSEARKYHLNLIVANQFTTQLTEEIRDAVFGNMGTIVAFRVGQNDVDSLSRYFQPTFDGDDLLRVPNYNSIVRTLIGGVPTQPFSMAALPPLGTANPRLGQALKQLTAAKYGRPKAIVGAEIAERMAVKSTTRRASSAGRTRQQPAKKPAGKGSFLDEWLDKRRTGTPQPTVGAAKSQMAQQPASQPAQQPMQQQAPPQSAPFQPPVAPTQPAPATQNISSNELEQAEVSQIAAELKQQLDTPAQPQPAQQSEPVVQPTLPKLKAKPKTEASSDLKPGDGDTIFIDRDGSFRGLDSK